MAAERGWRWPTSKVRQTQLVEWLVTQVAHIDTVAGRNIPVEPFYSAQLPGQPEGATFEIARDEPGAHWRIYAPHGLGDVFNLVARPNPVLAPFHVYQAKTTRWRQQWPSLTVLPWPAHAGDTATS